MCSDHLSKFPTRSWTIFALACLFVATISCVNLFYYDDLFDWFHFRNLNTRNATVLDAMMIQRKHLLEQFVKNFAPVHLAMSVTALIDTTSSTMWIKQVLVVILSLSICQQWALIIWPTYEAVNIAYDIVFIAINVFGLLVVANTIHYRSHNTAIKQKVRRLHSGCFSNNQQDNGTTMPTITEP